LEKKVFLLMYGGMTPLSPLKGKMINSGLSKYLEFWKMGMCKDETYAIKLGPYMDYWEHIFELLSKLLLTQNSNC
jgi:hypothetical protein